jgi:hypothetical protein
MVVVCAADLAQPSARIRRPLGPDELPDYLPGRWKVSLCISTDPDHAWIRFENVETGEVRSVSRFHLLVGGWFDAKHLHWNYGLTTRTGVYMDREQSLEEKLGQGYYRMLSAYVDNPRILKGEHEGRGHGVVKNNCVTYTRDAWHFYTGEYYPLPEGVHTPDALCNCILHYHPEVLPEPAVQ